MEDQVFSFTPVRQEELMWFWAGAIVAIAAGSATFLLMRKGWKGSKGIHKSLIAMLLFFIALSGIGAALFSGMQLSRLQPLQIDAEGFSFRKNRIRWDNVTELRVAQLIEKNALNQPGEQSRMLIVRTSDGKLYFFSEKNYPLPEILGRLKELNINPGGN